MRKKIYDVKIQFFMTREQKDRFDYINDKLDVDLSTRFRELAAKFILENEHLLPDDLKFKPAESEN